jgi:DNA-binding NtrC family response regulator
MNAVACATHPAAAAVLVVDDHAAARNSMADVLRGAGHRVTSCASAIEAMRFVEEEEFDVIVTDLRMPGMSGLEFIQALQRRKIESQVIMVTAHASVSSAVEAMRHGAFDYIEKPLDADALEKLVARALRHAALCDRKTNLPPAAGRREPVAMIGTSAAMLSLRQRIAQVARTSETVLITGESGTGKELVARAVHAASDRAGAALVGLNCPALSPQLMESELFGHERGAFTSADAPRVGRFELADGGTILLDEVSEIEMPLQAKLLRVLQERAFERVGSSETLRVDLRVLSTTNRDLRAEVAAGRFREDLYFRLAVLPLHVPPLRQRREDVPELAAYFLGRIAARLGNDPPVLDDSARALLVEYHWPGNVRELENIITRASVLSTRSTIGADDLRLWLIDATAGSAGRATQSASETTGGASLEDMERRLIENTLERFGGHRAKTAEALGIGVRTLANKLRSYGYAPRARSFSRAA